MKIHSYLIDYLSYRLTCMLFWIMLFPCLSYAQDRQTQFSGFGHLEFSFIKNENERRASFAIGEHAFFVTSNITNKISFLGEYVIRFDRNSATNYLPSIERSLVKFNYVNNHSIIVGKIHSPVNYWNDSYHHGRLLFPVIDRPSMFNNFIPLHTLGMQFQGQNLGPLNFGYDVVIGNSISSIDVLNESIVPSLTGAVHIKPKEDIRIGISYYWDDLQTNIRGVHAGHNMNNQMSAQSMYTGPVNFRLLSFSFAKFSDNYELLNETAININQNDSTGRAKNFSQFLYAGYNLNEQNTPFILLDYVNIEKNDVHVMPKETLKFVLGYRYSFSYLLNLKIQLEMTRDFRSMNHMQGSRFDNPCLRVQLAYGF